MNGSTMQDDDGSWWVAIPDDDGKPDALGPFSSEAEARNCYELLYAPIRPNN